MGKTTTAVNIAAALALQGLQVLVIDLDPQGNASTALGVDHREGTPSSYEVLIGEIPLRGRAPAQPAQRAAVLRAGDHRPRRCRDRVGQHGRPRRAAAQRARPGCKDYDFDYVFIDCPPSLGLLTINALVAAPEVLIPIQCEYYALEGVGQLLRNIEMVKSHLNPELNVSTVILTMYDGRTKLADQVADDVRAHFGDKVLRTVIPRSVKVSEAPGLRHDDPRLRPGLAGRDELSRRQPREIAESAAMTALSARRADEHR